MKTNSKLEEVVRGRAYNLLAILGFSHASSKGEGYLDGWDKLMNDANADAAMMFYSILPSVILKQGQRRVLLDGLASQYTTHDSFVEYTLAGD